MVFITIVSFPIILNSGDILTNDELITSQQMSQFNGYLGQTENYFSNCAGGSNTNNQKYKQLFSVFPILKNLKTGHTYMELQDKLHIPNLVDTTINLNVKTIILFSFEIYVGICGGNCSGGLFLDFYCYDENNNQVL